MKHFYHFLYKLNLTIQYWGWAKYRYCEVLKKTFDNAKVATVDALDSCPTETIQRFCNQSWRFISAYRIGLTGKAAAWAIRKQKGHRTCLRRAMAHLDAILNP